MHLMFAVSRPGGGAGTLRARMHIIIAVSRPGSGPGTLRARMHLMSAVSRLGRSLGTLQARMHLMFAVSRPGSGLGTLRARMLLMFAVSRSGGSLGTLRACMHAQALLCGTTATQAPLSAVYVLIPNCRYRLTAAGLLVLHAFGNVPKSHAKVVQHLSTASPGYRLTCTRVCLSYSQG